MGTIRQLPLATFPPPSATESSSTSSTSSSSSTTIISTCVSHSQNTFPHQQQQQQHRSRVANMLRNVVAIVVLLGLVQLASASPVFVDNPSLAQFWPSGPRAINSPTLSAAGEAHSAELESQLALNRFIACHLRHAVKCGHRTECVQSGRNIRHLPCIVRKSGRSGICMFAIDCIKQNGTHLGTCIDRFYFGSCCQMKDERPLYAPEISDNSIDQNTISHFSHESTTLPTSALFKLTTESQSHAHGSSSSSSSTGTGTGSEALKNVTQSYSSTKFGSTSSTSTTTKTTAISDKPIRLTPPSRRPPAHTTHKSSQFVVRTTAKPKPKPSTAYVEPTTIKPMRRKTTVAAPVLTTDAPKPQLEQRIEFTTAPTKFYTFQMVETTTPMPTEPTSVEALPTTTHSPHRTNPTSDSLVTELKTSTTIPVPTTSPTTTTTTTTTTSTPLPSAPHRATSRPKPQVTRRPTTTKKPTQTKRPSANGKPTRKPVQPVNDTFKPALVNTTTSTTAVRKPTQPTTTISNDELPTDISSETKPTHKPANTTQTHSTRAPRPKPKPTAEIVKVPKPTLGVDSTTTSPAPTTAAPATVVKVTKAPTSTASRPKPTVTKTTKAPTTTTSSTTPSTTSTTTTTTTTLRPKPTTTTTTAAPSTTTAKVTTLTTEEAPKAELPTASTTFKPSGLITWTTADAEPTTNATSSEEEWQPRPQPADWIPVNTIAPETADNKGTVELGEASTTEAAESLSSSEKIIISITSSVSEIMHNASASISKPAKPMKPERPTTTTTTSTTTTTTTTPAPTTTTTTTTMAPKHTSTTTTTTTTTTEASSSVELDTSTNYDMSTEGISGFTTTTDYSTEDLSNANATTAAPVNSLEGVDYRQVCGRRMFPEPRIVGGSNAAFGRWPWQISLRQWRTSTYLHKCGAALLNENWAITAAHCVDNVPPSDLLLRLGEYDLAEEEEPYGYQERRVQIVASHPQFDPRTFEYDLALLRFYEPVAFQPNIIPVCVPENDVDFIGETAFVTGWGRLYEDGPLPSVLQEVAVPVINNTICETMYRAAGYIEHIPHIFICAGWKKGGYDSCEGDSGGPMVLQREEDKRFQLGGVISWGIGCAEANQPGVYTRISEFRDWINQILQF